MKLNNSVFLVVLSLVVAGAAHGDVIVNNLDSVIGGTNTARADYWRGTGFSTDDQAFIVDSVTLGIAESAAGAAALEIYTDGGGYPGISIGALDAPAIGAVGEYTFDAGERILLSPYTTYWLVLRPTSGTYLWTKSESGGAGASTEGPGVIEATFAVSSDDGDSWSYGTSSSVPFLQVVPEPSANLLALFSGGILVMLRWARRDGSCEKV